MNLTKDQTTRLEELRSSLAVSRTWRKKYEQTWKEYQLAYTGRLDRRPIGKDDPPFVNILLSTVQIATAASTVEDPAFEALPRTPGYVQFQPIVEAALDAQWEQGMVQEEFAQAMVDRFTIGDGWIKTTWERVEADSPEPDPATVEAMAQQIAMLAAYRNLEPGMIPSRAQIESYVAKATTELISNRPIVRRADPYAIWVDSEAQTDRDMRWIAQVVWHPLDYVRNNPQFDATERRKVKATYRLADAPSSLLMDEGDGRQDMLKRVALWEMYDVERRELTIWAEGQDEGKVLYGPHSVEEEMGGYAHPFERLRCIHVPNSFYSLGFVEACAPLQAELNDQRGFEAYLRRVSVPKGLVHQKNSESLRAWFESGDPLVLGEVEDDDQDLSGVVYYPQVPAAPQIGFQNGQTLLYDLDRTVGISSMERGVETQGTTSATEINAITGYISARARSFMRGTKLAMESVARRMLVLMQQNMDAHDYIWLQQEFGMEFPPAEQGLPAPAPDPFRRRSAHAYNGATLAGEWQLKIRVDTGTADGPARRKEAAMQFLQSMMPFIQSGTANVVEVMNKVLRDGYNIQDVTRFLAPAPAVQAPPTGQPGGIASPAGQNATAPGAGLPPGMEALMAQAGRSNVQ